MIGLWSYWEGAGEPALAEEQPPFQPGGKLVHDEEEYRRISARWTEIEASKPARSIDVASADAAKPPETVAAKATPVVARPIAVANEIHDVEKLGEARGLAMLLVLNELDD